MCGILGVAAHTPVNQLLYDGLMVLQHRGQDAAGIATAEGDAFHMHKGQGLVRDVFRTRNMRALPGNFGIAHCRYPTAGSCSDSAESQPFYVNSPFGLVLAHNGNLTNTVQLQEEMFRLDRRHINTSSDSEVLLNVFAHELQTHAKDYILNLDAVFAAVAGVHRRCRGAYAVVMLIAGYGLLAFRDPYGIRPLVIGVNETAQGPEYMLASESVALDTLGFKVLRDVAPGEAFVKNRYIGRTFIMPGQSTRKKSVRQKLNTVSQEFKGKRVLLVDDSVVRGTTSREIVEMARAAGALKVYFASAAPPVRFPNVYGIDMPTRGELIATGRNVDEIAAAIAADALVYQDLEALQASITDLRADLKRFDCSCFNGEYVTGDVTPEYLDAIEQQRQRPAPAEGTGTVHRTERMIVPCAERQ